MMIDSIFVILVPEIQGKKEKGTFGLYARDTSQPGLLCFLKHFRKYTNMYSH